MDRELCSSCRKSFGNILMQESQEVHRELYQRKLASARAGETEADNLSKYQVARGEQLCRAVS